MVRLKSLEGSDGTALALLSNDVNASVALCRDLLGSHCAAAAFVLSAADEAATAVASHLDRVLFCGAPAPAAAEAAKPSLLQLQCCIDDSERLRSQGGAHHARHSGGCNQELQARRRFFVTLLRGVTARVQRLRSVAG